MLTAATIGQAQSYAVDSIAGSYLIPSTDTVLCMQSHHSGNLFYGTSGTTVNTASFSKVYANSITSIVSSLGRISAMDQFKTPAGDSILFYSEGQPWFKRYSGTGSTLQNQNSQITAATAKVYAMRSFSGASYSSFCLVGGNYTYNDGSGSKYDLGYSTNGTYIYPFFGATLFTGSICHDFTMEVSDTIFSCGYLTGGFGTTNIMLHRRDAVSASSTMIHTASGTVTEIELFQNQLYYVVGNILYRVPKTGGVAISLGSVMTTVNDLEIHDGKLFVGGSSLKSYDGSVWTTIITDPNLNGTVQTLESHQGSLYLAGDFLSINGDTDYRKICKLGIGTAPAINSSDIDNTVCVGSSINFTNSTNTNGTWSSCSNAVTGTTFNETFNTAGTCDINFAGTTNLGFPVVSTTLTITVNPLPNVGAGSDQAVCAGTAVTLNGSGASIYMWNNGIANSVSFNPVSTNTYTVTGTDANGCVNTDQVVVTINPLPSVNAGSDQSICEGTSVTLSASGASSYTWDNSVSNGVSFTPTGTVTYTVTGTNANGCVNTDQVVVTVNPNPTPVITFQGGELSTTNITSGSLYQWILNGTDVLSNDLTYIPTQNGSYTFYVMDNNGCDGISAPYIIDDLGLSESEIAQYVTITNGQMNVSIDWSIYDVTGRLVASGKPGKVDMPIGVFVLVTDKFAKKFLNAIED